MRAIFVKRTRLPWAIRYRPAEPPPSPRDENSTLVTKSKSGMSDKSDPEETLPRPTDEKYIFVKNCTPSEQMPPYPVAGQRADCRRRGFQFSSRDFPMGDGFSDPLLIAASFTHLEFSYRAIPLRRIRFACRLIAGAKFGRIFRQEMRKPVTPEASQAKKRRGDSLDENRSVVHCRSDLPRFWVRCGIDTACEVCGLACGSFSLMGMNDHHFQNEENEPHSENEKMTVICKRSPPSLSEMIIISVILK